MSTAPRLRLFNTASNEVEPLDLSQPVSLYVCGITPYDTTHLGHAFTYVWFDLLVRYLRALGVEVRYVQNVTDIDDDILIRSAKVGRDWRELGTDETRKFLEDMAALNWHPPTIVKATEHIPQMIALIEQLLDRGYAYVAGGSVYFEVAKDPQFGHRLCDLTYQGALAIANERGNFPEDPNKRDPLDFVLWQAAKEGEPTWESPWGPGRPGWHIECSAMSLAHLGQPVTVHGGGADLRFPHHEAEISQTERATGQPFVRCWMHTAMVHAERKKMSKSLGNMVFVRDLLQQYPPDAVRLYLLSHHYRHEWNYEAVEIERWAQVAADLRDRLAAAPTDTAQDEALHRGAEVIEALADDLDAPQAIEALQWLAAGDARARATARRLATDVFGLTLR